MASSVPVDSADVPPEYALVVIDVVKYSHLSEEKMAPLLADLDDILSTVLADCRITDPASVPDAAKDRGDGTLFVLPHRHAARLVDPFLPLLSQALERREQARLASSPSLRLRAGVHVGVLVPPNYRGNAANDVCRLVDSDAVRHASAAATDNHLPLAAVVSDPLFRIAVGADRTRALKSHHFQQATLRITGKPEYEQTGWLLVPGLAPTALQPYLTEDGPFSPGQAVPPDAKKATGGGRSAGVRQKGKARGKARLLQVGGDYRNGQEQS
ncbi:hypothetical protein ACWGJ2_32980 [Streptomyces sp. NPDC054796]